MNTYELQEKIRELKKEKDFCILAHAYQSQDVVEIADYVGDSFGLSLQAQNVTQKNVLMCGVQFMAETCKILSPEKHIYLSHPDAGCPMAEQLTAEDIKHLREKYPKAAVVAYINTTSELKAVSDVIVTSSSAVKIIRKLKAPEILFVPDPNLGAWIASQIPEKTFHFAGRGCPVHMRYQAGDIDFARKRYPNATILVHPEAGPKLAEKADFTGSTTAIMAKAKESTAHEIVIGTENSIVSHLQMECPEKRIYALSKLAICVNMQLTNLSDVYQVLLGEREELEMDPQLREKAALPIQRMIELGK